MAKFFVSKPLEHLSTGVLDFSELILTIINIINPIYS